MKKLIALLCTVSMLATLGACGESETSSDISESSVSTSETEKTTAEETTAEITTEIITDESTTEEVTESETETENIIEASTQNSTESETVPSEKATASSVMDYLINNTSNIGNFVEYDETTDTNGLLGRPGQYTSKINFAITTLEQTDENDPLGGSIEVFENHEDAMARYEYIQELGKKITLLAEYDYVNDYVLLRINFDVVPSEEEAYEQALDDYMKSFTTVTETITETPTEPPTEPPIEPETSAVEIVEIPVETEYVEPETKPVHEPEPEPNLEPEMVHFIINTDTGCVHTKETCRAAQKILAENYDTIDICEDEIANYTYQYWACGICAKKYSDLLPKFE